MSWTHGVPPEVWAAGTLALVYGSLWAVVPTLVFEGVERLGGTARTQFRVGLGLLATNLVVPLGIAGIALSHPLMGRTAIALFEAPLAWLTMALPRLEWLLVPTWMVGCTVVGARLAVAHYIAWQLVRTSEPDADLQERVETLCRRARLQPPSARMSDRLAVPVLVGVLRPALLVPKHRPEQLTADQYDAVLGHELGHFAHGDPLSGLLISLCELVFFFHPAVWRINARLRHLRECAADDFAVALTDNRQLASGLAAYACAPSPMAALTSTGGHLMDRIRRLIGGRRTERRAPILLLMAGLMTGCAALVADVSVGGPDHRAARERSQAYEDQYFVIYEDLQVDYSQEQVAALRARIAEDGDVGARVGLILALVQTTLQLEGDDALVPLAEVSDLTIALIAEHPAVFNWAPLVPAMVPLSRDRALAEWERQLVLHPNEPAVLAAAASWFESTDPTRAIQLLERAHALDPFTQDWKDALATRFAQHGDLSGVERVLDPMYSEAQLTDEPDADVPYDSWVDLDVKIQAALAAQEWEDVVFYAESYLALAADYESDWNYGNAIHDANSALGLAALHRNDEAAALAFLVAAGKTHGSPTLATFGPDSSLAHALAERGHPDEAADWVLSVGQYWDTDDPCSQTYVQRRADVVRAGGAVGEHAFHYVGVMELSPECL